MDNEPARVVEPTDGAEPAPSDSAVDQPGSAEAASEDGAPSLLDRLRTLGRDRPDGEARADATSGDHPDAGHEPDDEPSLLGTITGAAETAADTVGKAVTHTTSSLRRGAGGLAAGAARRLDERTESRQRRQGRQARDPLPVLWEVHPQALNAPRRDLGLITVPLDQIRGTAVEGSQRGGDFKPIPRLRGANWLGRWNRIKAAINRLEPLPPVDLIKAGSEYWVEDGHNRVAAALELDQVALDASVIELLVPGLPHEVVPANAGQYLAESMRELRAAGQGRRTRTAAPAIDLEDTEALRRDFDPDHSRVGE